MFDSDLGISDSEVWQIDSVTAFTLRQIDLHRDNAPATRNKLRLLDSKLWISDSALDGFDSAKTSLCRAAGPLTMIGPEIHEEGV